MGTLYLICAVFGGTILVIQTLMLLIGLGGHDVDLDGADAADLGGADAGDFAGSDVGDASHSHVDVADAADSTTFFKVLSLKTVVAFLTFFGLVGLLGQAREMTETQTLLASIGAGVVAVFAVGYMMAGLARLQSSGNVDLRRAVGASARVYLRIPGAHGGRGRVTLELEGRQLECAALTDGPDLPTGAEVRVVEVRGPNTVEVRALS